MNYANAVAYALCFSFLLRLNTRPRFAVIPSILVSMRQRPLQTLPRVKCKFHTGGQVISSPAIVDDTAYVGSTDHNLYAIDLETGMQKWKFEKVRSRITSSPFGWKKGYFGTYDEAFYALEATKGQLIWKFQTAGERRFAGKHLHGAQPVAETMPDPFDFYLSSPALWNGAVYFGSGDGNIYALDMASGKVRWKFQTGDVVHSLCLQFPMAHYLSGVGIVIFMRLMLNTDKEKWRFKNWRGP